MKKLLKKRTVLIATLIVVASLMAIGFTARRATAAADSETSTVTVTVAPSVTITNPGTITIAATPGVASSSAPAAFTVTANTPGTLAVSNIVQPVGIVSPVAALTATLSDGTFIAGAGQAKTVTASITIAADQVAGSFDGSITITATTTL